MTTLAAAVQRYLQRPTAEATRHEYANKLGVLAAQIGPDQPISGVTGDQLIAYMDRLKTEPMHNGKLRKPSSVKSVYTIIKGFFSWCRDQELIDTSPADRLRVGKVANEGADSRAMTDVELLRILEYWRHKPRNYALLLFIADTGCRVGGAASLQISRLDLEQRRAFIREKGDKEVKVLFGPTAADALATWLDKRPKIAKHDYVWTGQGPAYEPLSRFGIADVIRRAAAQVGAEHDYPHSLRHRVGVTMARAGKDPDVIRRKLNHSDVMTTLKFYCRADDEYLQRVSDEFAVKPAPGQREQDGPKVIRANFRRTS